MSIGYDEKNIYSINYLLKHDVSDDPQPKIQINKCVIKYCSSKLFMFNIYFSVHLRGVRFPMQRNVSFLQFISGLK